MKEIQLLNIPVFYSSYYLLGLSKEYKLSFKRDRRFDKYHNKGFLIFKVDGKFGVIDNHDPIGVNQELYDQVDLYFATNKLLNHPSYDQEKVRPLFPHFPVNILPLYFKLFHINLIRLLKPKDLAREIYVYQSRPDYKLEGDLYKHTNNIFFSGSTWKKEPWANQIRAEFIRACKIHPGIKFEGGFIPRSDGDNFGYDAELNQVKYPPKKFSEMSAKSLVSLNNPAVLGAVSWRLAENWNSSTFVLSFPFAIDLPIVPEHGEEIHYIKSSEEYKGVLDKVLNEPQYHEKVAKGGKSYFDTYCTPEAQAKYIVENLLNKS
ncbi:MAG: hypothetical protein PSV36_10290 [Algoriphagus sp.]|nr:hypothetical protein [Algoriphagus sp.]